MPLSAIQAGRAAALRASVKAPFSWPKSWLSSSVSGMAGQLTRMKVAARRRE